MKVLFLFMSKGSAPAGSVKSDDWKKQDAADHYQTTYGDECYFTMFQDLVKCGVISDLTVVFESGVGPGKAKFVKGARNFVVPEINLVREFIEDDTIIFVRGGFKHWHDFLVQFKEKNWLICYAANTGRDKWPWWDIVFDDLEMKNIVDRYGRYYFPFIKPTNENVFGVKTEQIKYDICIGASHIHDKKGQWKAVKVIEAFHKKFGYYPTAIMPGSPRRSTETIKMFNKQWVSNEINLPGMTSKPELSNIFACCKVFMHLGAGGQNDRSILEAHACGMPVILSNSPRFTPLLKEDGISTFIFDPESSFEEMAERLYMILANFNVKGKIIRHSIYKRRMGYYEVVLPMLKDLFNQLDSTIPSKEVKQILVNIYKSFKQGKEDEKRID